MLILNVLKRQKKAMERRILIEKTGISDKNISAKLNSLETKGLITSERTRKGRTVNRWVQITKEGKDAKTLKIEVTPKPKKIGAICERCEKQVTSLRLYKRHGNICDKCYKEIVSGEVYYRKYGKFPTRIEIPKKIEPKEKIIPKPSIKVVPKKLPATIELKKELRLLINLVFTHRREVYLKYGYKDVNEVRVEIDTLIDQLGR